jgi:transcriptional regulator with XRE-family HTH domain
MQARVEEKKRYSGYFALPGLRYWRIERGLSMRELAQKANVTLDTIWRLETLQRRAEPKTRRRLARALDVGLPDLSNEPSGEEADER